MERIYQNIRETLLAIKIKQKKDYDIRIALINPENAQNNALHTVIKYKPKEVFNNSNETQYEIIKDNIKKSQININKNVEKLQVNTNVIISNIYIKGGTKLKVKYNTIGVRIISGIIKGNNGNTTYKVKIFISFKDLKLINIYDMKYKLLKKS